MDPDLTLWMAVGGTALVLLTVIAGLLGMMRQQGRRLRDLSDSLRSQFGELSLEALQRATQQLAELTASRMERQQETGNATLESKRQLIDQHLKKVTEQLDKMASTVQKIEKERTQDHVNLGESIRATQLQTKQLMDVTVNLQQALSSSQSRGQWGERIAEDILRHAGFVEGVNYIKQKRVTGSGAQPDFTFILPRGFTLNMDVKFPFAKYLKLLEAQTDVDQEVARKGFFADVKLRIKEIAGKDYINADQNTVDCVLMFVPNEQVFTFIQQENSELFEQAMKKGIVVCSPMTLFAVLAVIRQAVDNFSLEQKSQEILKLMQEFRKQWQMFTDKFDGLDQRISQIRKEFDHLATTRVRAVERPLRRIEALAENKSLVPENEESVREIEGASSAPALEV